MKQLIASAIATVITAAVWPAHGEAQDIRIHVSGSTSSTAPTTNAGNAVAAYLAACKAQDEQRIARTMTTDAEIEYATDEPGQYLAVDLNTAEGCWAGIQSMNSKAAVVDVWIYPTPAPDVVFVDFVALTTVGRDSHNFEHLALIRTSGTRIAQIRDFSTSQPQSVLAANGGRAANPDR